MCLAHDGERMKGLPRSRGPPLEVIDGVSCRKVNETTTNGQNGHKETRLSPGVVGPYVGGVGGGGPSHFCSLDVLPPQAKETLSFF